MTVVGRGPAPHPRSFPQALTAADTIRPGDNDQNTGEPNCPVVPQNVSFTEPCVWRALVAVLKYVPNSGEASLPGKPLKSG